MKKRLIILVIVYLLAAEAFSGEPVSCESIEGIEKQFGSTFINERPQYGLHGYDGTYFGEPAVIMYKCDKNQTLLSQSIIIYKKEKEKSKILYRNIYKEIVNKLGEPIASTDNVKVKEGLELVKDITNIEEASRWKTDSTTLDIQIVWSENRKSWYVSVGIEAVAGLSASNNVINSTR